MKTPLLLAALIALPLAASAQSTDAAFADSLGAIAAPVAASKAQFKLLKQKPAAPQAKTPAAKDADWQKLVEAVKKDGKYSPEAGFMPGSFSIEDSTGDPKGDHESRSVGFMGGLNDDEKFEPIGAALILRTAKLDPKTGNFNIEIWMFQTDVYGEVQNAGHGTGVESADGKPLSKSPDKLDPADPKVQAKLDEMVKYWAERKS